MNPQKQWMLSICRAAALGAATLSASCWAGSDRAPGGTTAEHSEQALIAGFAANSSELDAVGSMSLMWTDSATGASYFDLICSSYLIDADTAVTAKHCLDVVAYAYQYGYRIVFTLGPLATAPTRWVEVIDTERAPGETGGFTGLGQDIAVLHLAEELNDVHWFGYAQLNDSLIGTDFADIGYGEQDVTGNYGTRRVGGVTLRARTGRVYEILLGSFDAFYEWYTGEPVPSECIVDAGIELTTDPVSGIVQFPLGRNGKSLTIAQVMADDMYDCWLVEYLRSIYDSTVLEQDQVIAGGAPGNSQPCYGDSGSPMVLARKKGGRLVAYGHVLGGIRSRELQCDYGGVFASFNPQILEFLTDATRWVDPCAGLSTAGTCDGSVVRRCTNPLEGKRRAIEFDCKTVGLSCEPQSDGSVGCGAEDKSIARAPQAPRVAGSAPSVSDLVEDTFIQPGDPL